MCSKWAQMSRSSGMEDLTSILSVHVTLVSWAATITPHEPVHTNGIHSQFVLTPSIVTSSYVCLMKLHCVNSKCSLMMDPGPNGDYVIIWIAEFLEATRCPETSVARLHFNGMVALRTSMTELCSLEMRPSYWIPRGFGKWHRMQQWLKLHRHYHLSLFFVHNNNNNNQRARWTTQGEHSTPVVEQAQELSASVKARPKE